MDIRVENEGTITLLHPQTPAGTEWVEENIGQDNGFQPQWPTVVVEHRYVRDIIDGMIRDGLEVE